jgi:hypothetical protein
MRVGHVPRDGVPAQQRAPVRPAQLRAGGGGEARGRPHAPCGDPSTAMHLLCSGCCRPAASALGVHADHCRVGDAHLLAMVLPSALRQPRKLWPLRSCRPPCRPCRRLSIPRAKPSPEPRTAAVTPAHRPSLCAGSTATAWRGRAAALAPRLRPRRRGRYPPAPQLRHPVLALRLSLTRSGSGRRRRRSSIPSLAAGLRVR